MDDRSGVVDWSLVDNRGRVVDGSGVVVVVSVVRMVLGASHSHQSEDSQELLSNTKG